MVSQCTKYEVSRFTRYVAVNGGAKCKNGVVWSGQGHSRSTAMSPFDRAHTTSYSTLIETVFIFYRFRDIAGYWSKVADFDPTHLHLVPPQGVTPVEFRGSLWCQETRVPGLWCGVVCVILRLAVVVEHRLVTDGRTDRQTDTGPWLVPRRHSIAR